MRKISSYIVWGKLSNGNRGGIEGKILIRKFEMEIILWKMGRDKSLKLF